MGYLSYNFYEHAVARLIAQLIERHDRDQFEIVAYAYGPDDGSVMRKRLVAAFDRFVDVPDLPPAEVAARIRADGIDILVDLMGYVQFAKPEIVTQRPAPLQISYLGYPATMGAGFIDYILADPYVTPMDWQPFFAERSRSPAPLLPAQRHVTRGQWTRATAIRVRPAAGRFSCSAASIAPTS